MKRATCLIGMIIAAYLMTTPAVAGATQGVRALDAPAAVKVRIAEGYGKLPLSFEANRGQTDGQVKFLSRGSGYTLFLTSTGAVLALSKPAGKPSAEQPVSTSGTVVRMKLIGGNSASRITGLQELPGKSHYFIGNDPAKWRTNVPSYAQVRYENVYPGVELIYYGNQRQLEYDFVVAPGADPHAIKLVFEGAGELTIDTRGDLLVSTVGGDLRLQRPLVYQEVGGVKLAIASRYVLDNQRHVGFHVAAYDRSKALVIDPVLSYSTYLGGSISADGTGIAVDGAGHAYVTGLTRSADFPTTAGAVQTSCIPRPDLPNACDSIEAFVTKLDPTGSALVYSTYLGGSDLDEGFGIAVDSAGHAYVTGVTESPDFPTTAGAFQPTFGGGAGDAFVTKLDPTGSLVYSTYLGGANSGDKGEGIAVDSAGHAYLTGFGGSDFPTTAEALQPTIGGSPLVRQSFVAKLNPTGNALVYSTYLGGSRFDRTQGIAVDSAGHAYVTGLAESADFPTTAGAVQTSCIPRTFPPNACNSADAFVTKLDPTGSALVYSTYLGGSGNDHGLGIAVDGTGHAYVTGSSSSTDFPTTAGAFQTAFRAGGIDAFVTKLNPSGSALVYSTYLGGSGSDLGFALAVDSAGHAYLAGRTSSTDFSTTAGAFQTAFGGGNDAFVTKLDPTGAALVYSTYLGGGGSDPGRGIAVDIAGNAYVTGTTSSTDFPTTAGAFQPTLSGTRAAFVAKISTATIGELVSQVATLDLNAGQTSSLTSKLEAAEGSLARGNATPAINQLDAFINEVRALERSGRLDAATAEGLIAQTQAIISEI